jgi:hypothetical protein
MLPPIIVVLNAQLEDEFVAMIDVIVHSQSATLALQKVGNQADSILPAVGIEGAVIDRLDNLRESLKRNVEMFAALGHGDRTSRVDHIEATGA